MRLQFIFKYAACVVAVFLLSMNLSAEEQHNAPNFLETKSVEGFWMGVTDENGFTNTILSRRLCFTIGTTNRVWATNHLTMVSFPIEPEYSCLIDLFDAKGQAIPKTEAGEKIGIHFLILI